jgi:hypothetical protein
MFVTSLLLLLSVFSVSGFKYTEEALNDQVNDLPGLDWDPKFNQFSGYLNVEGTEKYIHYWLVESVKIKFAVIVIYFLFIELILRTIFTQTKNPRTDPVTFWTNGGPVSDSNL